MELHFNPRGSILAFTKDHANIQQLQFIIEDPTGVKIDLLEGGLINYVFRVQSKDGLNSIVIKYAEEKLRLVPGGSMDLRRQELEFESLNLIQQCIPGSAPQPFCFDPKHQMMAMEDLGGMKILGDELKKGNVDVKVAENIGKLLANMHEATSKCNVDKQLWKEWEHTFWDKCKDIQEGYNRWISFDIFNENHSIINNTQDPSTECYKRCAKIIREKGIVQKLYDLFNEKHCFLNADAYWNSVFYKDGQVKLFDFEFSFLGHPANSLGWMVGSYLLCMLEAMGRCTSGAVALSIFHKSRQAADRLLQAYINQRPIFKVESQLRKFISETALFVGQFCFVFVFQKNLESLIRLKDEDKTHAALCGKDMLVKHEEMVTIEDLVKEMFMDRSDMQMD